MLTMATFYRNIESLFEGALLTRNTLELNITPAGFIRTTGKDKLRVNGIANSTVVTEEIAARLSSYMFSHVNYIEPVTLSFTGKISVVDSSGVGIPVNRVLFTLPVEIGFTYLGSLTLLRGQDEIGTIAEDKIVDFIAKYSIISTLKLNDYIVANNKTYIIKNLHSVNIAYWKLQTVIREP